MTGNLMACQRGMTLLEVLVAISVLMLVGFSALQFQNFSADQLLTMQQQQYGLQVAQNQLVLARLEEYRDLRSQRGDEQQGGMTLRWQREVEAVDGFAMKRVIVRVMGDNVAGSGSSNSSSGSRQLAELTGYIASPE